MKRSGAAFRFVALLCDIDERYGVDKVLYFDDSTSIRECVMFIPEYNAQNYLLTYERDLKLLKKKSNEEHENEDEKEDENNKPRGSDDADTRKVHKKINPHDDKVDDDDDDADDDAGDDDREARDARDDHGRDNFKNSKQVETRKKKEETKERTERSRSSRKPTQQTTPPPPPQPPALSYRYFDVVIRSTKKYDSRTNMERIEVQAIRPCQDPNELTCHYLSVIKEMKTWRKKCMMGVDVATVLDEPFEIESYHNCEL